MAIDSILNYLIPSSYSKNIDERTVHKEYDYNGDGTADSIYDCTYDKYGNETSKIKTDAEGNLVDSVYYTYDEDRNIISIEKDTNGDGTINYIKHIDYDKDGNLVSVRYDNDANGAIDKEYQYEYDKNGNNTKVVIDSDGDGIANSTTTYEYNEDGKVVSTNAGGGFYVAVLNIMSNLAKLFC